MPGYERPHIAAMTGYVSGEQPDDADTIKLNTNENPYPPSPHVATALSTFDVTALRRYPAPNADAFRAAAAHLHAVQPTQVLATHGGDELLRLALTTFLEPGQPLGVLNPSYSLYDVLADVHGSPVFAVDATDDWRPPADFAAQCNAANCQLVCLVNPHAPSGAMLPIATIRALAEAIDGVLLLDEAYIDFVDPDQDYNAIPLINEYDNLLILRSLSKGYSMAGLRFGYGLGPESLIEPMAQKTRDSYNQDVIAQVLATAALEHQTYAASTWERVRSERTRMTTELTTRGFDCAPSQTNFLLAQSPTGSGGNLQDHNRPRARDLYQGLKAAGILVRYFDKPRLRDRLRITIGTPVENERLLTALDALLT